MHAEIQGWLLELQERRVPYWFTDVNPSINFHKKKRINKEVYAEKGGGVLFKSMKALRFFCNRQSRNVKKLLAWNCTLQCKEDSSES